MMEINLETKIQYLKGVGPKMGAKLNRLGIEKVEDLLMYWPRRYEDYTDITQIKNLRISNFQTQTIRAKILGIGNKKTRRRGFTVTEAVVEDGTGSIKVVWFNQPYLAKMLRAGSEVILNGKVSIDPYSRELVMESPNRANKPKIMPIYGETAGLSSYFITRQIANTKSQIANIKEFLPEDVIKKNQLLDIQEAILNIHEPANSGMLEKARERLAFDELFLISMRANLARLEIKHSVAPKISANISALKKMIESLPFELTADQRKALWQIIKDLERNIPMNRLLDGDVGSGKTAVAALASYLVALSGYRTLLMAPTEILANQHYTTCCKMLSKFDISVGLITSSQMKIQSSKSKCQIKSKSQKFKPNKANLANEASQADLVIGTHALIQQKANFSNIGLVIVDEQHRFGVKQREALVKKQVTSNNNQTNPKSKIKNPNKANSAKMSPHYLSMTATPIPRTLYLALFADLDLSVIKTMPKGRKEIKTKVVPEGSRDKAYNFIREQIKKGRQAFVICPLIESQTSNLPASPAGGKPQTYNSKSKNFSESHPEQSEGSQPDSSVENSFRMTPQELFDVDRKSVVAEYEKLSKNIFSDLKIGMLHGRMPASPRRGRRGPRLDSAKRVAEGGKSKNEEMAKFKAGKIDILVSTSVVEVGVDISNATIMMIEDAERFGLAGLHQFRGRVGRAEHQSFCFLFSNSKNPAAINRLRAMEETSDGFKLAEIDLKNRGAGDIFGTLQSGDLNLKMASLSDRILIEKASDSAKEIIEEGIDKYPKLLEKLKQAESSRHLE